MVKQYSSMGSVGSLVQGGSLPSADTCMTGLYDACLAVRMGSSEERQGERVHSVLDDKMGPRNEDEALQAFCIRVRGGGRACVRLSLFLWALCSRDTCACLPACVCVGGCPCVPACLCQCGVV